MNESPSGQECSARTKYMFSVAILYAVSSCKVARIHVSTVIVIYMVNM